MTDDNNSEQYGLEILFGFGMTNILMQICSNVIIPTMGLSPPMEFQSIKKLSYSSTGTLLKYASTHNEHTCS
jgi:hypothetical protein